MRVAITGSTGLIGQAIIPALMGAGHEPVRVIRTTVPDGLPVIRWDPIRGEIDSAAIADVDAVVHLAGEPIGGRRWSDSQKEVILQSRVMGTKLVAASVAEHDRPRILMSSSAIGYYGDRGDEVLTEASGPGSGFVTDVVTQWERYTSAAVAAGKRVTLCRNGLVLSPDGGSLAEQLPFFRVGLGGHFGSGRQWWSWVSLTDTVAAFLWLLAHEISGPVNVTAPNPVTNKEFTRTLGRVLRRPAFVRTPKLAVQARLGRELTEAVVYSSARVEPSVLIKAGFVFTHPHLEPALRALLGRP